MTHSSTTRLMRIAGLLTASLSTAAHAQTVSTSVDATAEVQATEIVAEDSKPQADTTRYCPRETGTHIAARAKDGKRCNTIGRVYTSDDLQRTGGASLGDALRKLDPAIR